MADSRVIVGSAGHVDHGKSSLIFALNGFWGDSRPSEIERGITIDLSFSALEGLSFIDVPGHESLVKTMVSGAFGFDACLFVVDINEGLMPQSIEHAQILRALGLGAVILVLTKCDLFVAKGLNERSDEIKEELQQYIQVQQCFCTSIKDESSVLELKNYLLSLKPKKRDEAPARLWVDRAFNIKGFGSVVTGTLGFGALRLDELLGSSLGFEVKINALEVHKERVQEVKAPARLSINYKGKALKKGSLLFEKGLLASSYSFDAVLSKELEPGDFRLCVGTASLIVRLRHLGDKYYSVHMKEPLPLCFGDRFILLREGRFCSGARVVNAINEPMKKPKKLELLRAMDEKDYKKAFALILDFHKRGFDLKNSYQRFALSKEEAFSLAKDIKNSFLDEKSCMLYSDASFSLAKEKVFHILQKNPLALLSATSLALSLKYASKALCQRVLLRLQGEGILKEEEGVFFNAKKNLLDLKRDLEQSLLEELSFIRPKAPYNIYDDLGIDRKTGDLALKKLCNKNLVLRLEHNVYVAKKVLDSFIKDMEEDLKTGLDVSSLKIKFNLSRKYAIAYLEYLDRSRLVKNIDNVRYLL